MTSRRSAITDAAIATLAAEGLRGLTHRAVDKAAGLSEGSTSYYFRTRHALLAATVERLAELDADELAPVTPVPGRIEVDVLAGMMAGMAERAATVHRDRALARYELSLEAVRRPELREVLVSVGERYRRLAADLLVAAGATDPGRQGRALVAFLDGAIFDRIAGANRERLTGADLHRSFAEALHGMLAGTP
ncbi:TetR family transcriptional regulator [Actinokineospora auranticolor]|uniref:DNA-binding transcriptional regulator YbjK n=1 Tax=Actinokineospora auranticolor TaxID=155976 RepID=A0A2S6GUM5_9PSEU|nr:TetR family transcriptional regulator [Actinokineospora auranticolor]PPK68910.1 DNA-binding transcriptional regulator YbjK [Actinokineospora auranticolor]